MSGRKKRKRRRKARLRSGAREPRAAEVQTLRSAWKKDLRLSSALLLLLLLLGLLRWQVSQVEFDDAYISYRYAHNLADGKGLVFNPGSRVEGYTNLLWILLLAGGESLGVRAHRLAPFVGVASYLATLALGWIVVWFLHSTRSRQLRVQSTLPLAALVLPPGLAATAGSGMETHFFALLVLALGVVMCHTLPNRTSLRIVSDLLPLAVVLTRPDGLIFVVAGFLVLAVRIRCLVGHWRRVTGPLFLRILPTLAGTLAYVAWKLSYFGSVVPNTYFAKGAEAAHYDAGVAYVRGFLGSYPQVLLLLPLILLGSLLASTLESRLFTVYALVGVLTYSVLLVRVGGDFMEYRLALHFYALLVVAAVPGLAWLLPRARAPASLWLGAILGACLMPTGLETRYYMQSLDEMNGYVRLGTRVGKALREFPAETKVATTLIGTTGYYSGLEIVDQWGLVDPIVARGEARDPFVRGHLRFAPLGHVRERGAHLYLEHPQVCSCTSPCVEDLPNVFIRLGDDDCVRSWYLTEEPNLTEFLCANPADYILHRVTCSRSH